MKLLQDIDLKHGVHASPDDGMCAMEAVAWYMDETHTDRPQCVSPVIAAAMRYYNDWLQDDKRNVIIKPLLLEVIGTNTSLEDEIARAKISAEYASKFRDLAAKYAAEYAAKYAAEYAESAAEYAARSAKSAAKSAESAAEVATLIGQHIVDMCKVGK